MELRYYNTLQQNSLPKVRIEYNDISKTKGIVFNISFRTFLLTVKDLEFHHKSKTMQKIYMVSSKTKINHMQCACHLMGNRSSRAPRVNLRTRNKRRPSLDES